MKLLYQVDLMLYQVSLTSIKRLIICLYVQEVAPLKMTFNDYSFKWLLRIIDSTWKLIYFCG